MDVEATKGVVGGLSLLLAPSLLLEALEVIVDDPGRWNAAHITFSFGMALSISAVGGLCVCWGTEALGSALSAAS